MVSIKVPIQHSIIAVTSTRDCDIPEDPDKANVAATANCIVVACRPASEGDTTIHLGPLKEIDPGTKPIFVGRLATPNREIRVWSVFWEVLLALPTNADNTEVHIWLDHRTEPSEVRIGTN